MVYTIIAFVLSGMTTLVFMHIAYRMGVRQGRMFAVEEYLERRREQYTVTWVDPVTREPIDTTEQE